VCIYEVLFGVLLTLNWLVICLRCIQRQFGYKNFGTDMEATLSSNHEVMSKIVEEYPHKIKHFGCLHKKVMMKLLKRELFWLKP